ncbi:MAG: hypothetical protein WC891_07670 [Actinomycetota bacterium]
MIYKGLYSQRKKINPDEDVFSYSLPAPVRAAIFNIIKNTNPNWSSHGKTRRPLKAIVKDFCENHLFHGITPRAEDAFASGYQYADHQLTDDLKAWIQTTPQESLFDFIEVAIINMSESNLTTLVKDINDLFQREMIGFEIVNGNIIDKSDEFLHQEVVLQPILGLKAGGFEKAEQDFMKALQEYAHKDYAGALTSANTAQESVMKRILGVEKGVSSDLVKTLVERGIIPSYMQNKMLLPVSIRNKDSDAHGRLDPIDVTPELAQYAIHCVGANVVFLLKVTNMDGTQQ